MTLSIEGLIFEEAMPWNDALDRYQLLLDSGNQVLVGMRISIQSDEGGVDNGFVE